MGDVLDLVHRLRKAEEHRALAVLARTEQRVSDSQARLAETEALLSAFSSASSEAAPDGVIQLQAVHQGALRAELERNFGSQT